MPEAEWRPRLNQSFAGLTDEIGRFGHGLLRHAHDRHVGLTPSLAKAVAAEASAHPDQLKPADARSRHVASLIGDRLTTHLGRVLGTGRSRLAPGMLTVYPVARFVTTPLGSLATEAVGESRLFGHVSIGKAKDSYEGYQEKLLAAVQSICESSEPAAEAFWDRAAAACWGTLRRSTGRASTVRGQFRTPPSIHAATLLSLLHLEPIFETSTHRRRFTKLRRLPSRTHRQGRKPQQAGPVDLRLTTDPEQFPQALLSEHIYPRRMRMTRIVDEGFAVYDRPPPRRTPRDALLVGLMVDLRRERCHELAKVAWLDAMARCAVALSHAGLRRTDQRWVQWASQQTLSVASVRLDDLPETADLDPFQLNRPQVLDVMGRLGWLPDALCDLPRNLVTGTCAPEFGERGIDHWARAAAGLFHGARDTVPARGVRLGKTPFRPHRLEDYDLVHVLVFARENAPLEDPGLLFANLRAHLRLHQGPRRHRLDFLGLRQQEGGRAMNLTWHGERGESTSIDLEEFDEHQADEALRRMMGEIIELIVSSTEEAFLAV